MARQAKEESLVDDTMRQKIGLFRYGLIADLLHGTGKRGLYRRLDEKAKLTYDIPGTYRDRVAAETIRDWLTAYRRGGFEALLPKPRCDMGSARAVPRETADLLCHLKESEPDLSVKALIAKVREKTGSEDGLALATVHRLLASHGLMKKGPEQPDSSDRRRFAYENAGELWMSDVMHGPGVFDEKGHKRKSYLVGIIDDATRLVPHAAFCLSENTTAFLPVLKQAMLRRGIPKRLYVDNGSAFRSHHLSLVCARLGVTLIHARPYKPQGKGKQERWFRSVRMQLLPTLEPTDLRSIEAMNRRLWGWIEAEYHHNPHRGLDGDTPLDRWTMRSQSLRLVDPGCDLDEVFLFELRRKVQKDRTVSLAGVAYEVDASLVGETVTLRFDPARRGSPVDVHFGGKKIHQAKAVDLYANCFVRRDHNTKALHADRRLDDPPPGLRLSSLDKEQN
jgi:transposase InsO family protein